MPLLSLKEDVKIGEGLSKHSNDGKEHLSYLAIGLPERPALATALQEEKK